MRYNWEMGRVRDKRGLRFGMLVVKERVASEGNARWRVLCDCGVECIVLGCSLMTGRTRSCGCQSSRATIGARSFKHGLAKRGKWHPLLRTWSNIVQRCISPKNPAFANYGGRGIVVYAGWLGFDCFVRDVHAEIGERPSKAHSFDRRDNDGPYAPGNIRWATRIEQNNNQRKTTRLAYAGQEKSLREWADEVGIGAKTIYTRVKRLGWSVEKALTTEV